MTDSFLKNFKEDYFSDEIPIRRRQEIQRKFGTKSNEEKLYYHACQARGNGEYAPNWDQKIERLKFFSKNKTICPENDRNFMKYFITKLDKYQNVGLQLGLFSGVVALFLPGIRRTPFYFRLPIAFTFVILGINFGNNYGKDLVCQRLRASGEYFERWRGIRNLFSGF